MELFKELDIKTNEWIEVFSACVGQMTVSQGAFFNYINTNSSWNLDLSKGIIKFGDNEYPVQLLGMEYKETNDWFWSWGIEGINSDITALANEIKAKGEEMGLDALTASEFGMNDFYNGHTLAMVSCTIADGNYCYYRVPTNEGALFVAFSGIPEDIFAPIPIEKFSEILKGTIKKLSLSYRIFVKAFLIWNKTLFEESDDVIIAHFPENLYISFEQTENGERISGIKA